MNKPWITNIIHTATILIITLVAIRSNLSIAKSSDKLPDSPHNQSQFLLDTLDQPLFFIENVGQFPPEVRFQTRHENSVVYFTKNALWFVSFAPESANAQSTGSREGVNLKLEFVEANSSPRLEPFTRLETHISYFLSHEPNKWKSNVPVWRGIRYVDLYPGVDLEITSNAGIWNWQFVIQDATLVNTFMPMEKQIVRVQGAESVKVDNKLLHLNTVAGDVTVPLLRLTVANGSTIPTRGLSPRVTGNSIHFPFIAAHLFPYESRLTTISPQDQPSSLLIGTFLGGFDDQSIHSIDVDASGHIYVAGTTNSAEFPTTPGAFDPTYNGSNSDAFVAKLNPSGTELIYASFLGGDSIDEAYAIAVNAVGEVFVAGTAASNFPTTPGAYDTATPFLGDAFVTKLNSTGTSLIYSTFLGGSSFETAYALDIDGSGAAYVAGTTTRNDFPVTPGAFDTTYNGGFSDIFVAKLDSSGSNLSYATFLGGGSDSLSSDVPRSLVVDSSGATYVAGWTDSADFPSTTGAFDPIYNGGNEDGFVTKINPTGSSLVYSTFLGGSSRDWASDITTDASGAAYIAGETVSSNFPTTPGAYNSAKKEFTDVFLVKLSTDGSSIIYGTFLGGNNNERAAAIALDENGFVYVAGTTDSVNFPTTVGAYDTTKGSGSDGFVALINAAGSDLTYSTFFGGSSTDNTTDMIRDSSGGIYLVGATQSSDFPTTPGAIDATYSSGSDAFVVKLLPNLSVTANYTYLPLVIR